MLAIATILREIRIWTYNLDEVSHLELSWDLRQTRWEQRVELSFNTGSNYDALLQNIVWSIKNKET